MENKRVASCMNGAVTEQLESRFMLSAEFSRAGSMGGLVSDVSVEGNIAYVSQGAAVQILDVSNPAFPIELGRVEGDAPATAQIAGTRLYIASDGGVDIVDVSNPAATHVLGHVDVRSETPLRSVELEGQYLYTLGDYGMDIIDVSDPASPFIVTEYPVMHMTTTMVVDSGTAYLTVQFEGVQIIDLSDPKLPKQVGLLPATQTYRAATIQGDLAYVANANEMLVWNIASPANPVFVTSYQAQYELLSIAADDQFAYIQIAAVGIQILDMSQPADPAEIGRFYTAWATDMAVFGENLYVCDFYTGLNIYADIQLPFPSRLSTYGRPLAPVQVVQQDNRMFVVDEFSGLVSYDASDPLHPAFEGQYDRGGVALSVVALAGNYAYLPIGQIYGIEIVDISGEQPTFVLNFDLSGDAIDAVAKDGVLYVTDSRLGLKMFDISDPRRPVARGVLPLPDVPTSLAVAGGYAYVSVGKTMYVVDVSDPANPSIAGTYSAGTTSQAYINDLSLINASTVALGHGSGVTLLDISDPSAPELLSHVGWDFVRSTYLRERYLYCAGPDLTVYDITDARNPVLVATLDASAQITDIFVQGRYIYANSSTYGMEIYRIDGNPGDILLDNASLNENAAAGTVVGHLSIADASELDSYTYALVDGPGAAHNDLFEVVGDELRLKTAPDYEQQETCLVRLRATDAAGLWVERDFTITVTDVNEAPTEIALNPATIAEHSPAGTSIGQLTLVDPDFGDTAIIELVDGDGSADNGLFEILDGELRMQQPAQVGTYSIRVRGTDAAGLYLETVFAIEVTNVNESPTAISLTNLNIAENAPAGTAIGRFMVDDPDLNDVFTFALVGGEGSADNAMFNIVDGQLRAQVTFNYEMRTSYSIRVRATDAGGMSIERVFAIAVTNMNDRPTAIALTNADIAEASPAGTAIGSIYTIDPDGIDVLTTSLVPGAADNAFFQIVDGELRSRQSFDYETKGSYSIRVRGTDAAGLSCERTLTIRIADIAETPIVVSGSAGNDVITATTIGTRVRVTLNGAIISEREAAGVSMLRLNGSAGDDRISLSSNLLLPALIFGGDGADTITGGAAADTIYGNSGNDRIIGGRGDDSIMAGLGADSISGDDGNDRIWGGDQSDTISGGAGNDYIEGKGKADTLTGGAGNDTLLGQAGADLIYGGDGDDWIYVDDGPVLAVRDTVYGGAGNDRAAWDLLDKVFEIEVELLA